MGHVNVVINDILRDVTGGKGFAQGGQFGPSFGTQITELFNKSEIRTARGEPVRRYSLSRDVLKSLSATDSWPRFLSFIYQTRGAVTSFLLDDPTDNSTFPDHYTDPQGFTGTWPNPPRLAAGALAGQTIQMTKRYQATDQLPPYERIISRPKTGGVEVYFDTTRQIEDTDFSVNYDTGLVTLLSSPPDGQSVFADCSYWVPVRFDEQTDEWLQASVGSGKDAIAGLPSLGFEEVLDFAQGSEARFFGGARARTIAGNIDLSIHDEVFQSITATGPGLSVTLPNPNPSGPIDQAPLALGGPYFTIENAGAESLEIRSQGVLIRTLAAGDWAEVRAISATPGPRDWLVTA